MVGSWQTAVHIGEVMDITWLMISVTQTLAQYVRSRKYIAFIISQSNYVMAQNKCPSSFKTKTDTRNDFSTSNNFCAYFDN